MKKYLSKSKVIAGVLAGAMFLTACAGGGTQPAAPTEPTAPAAETQQAETTPEPAANGGLETVVLYSNAISGGRGEWLQERAAEEIGIDLQLVDAGGVAIRNRLVAERYNPLGDVVFGLNQLLWVDMVNYDIITPYTPSWGNDVPAELNHPDGYFYAVALVANLLVYDTSQVDAENAPSDWLDLWQNEYWHGRHAFSQALTGSTTHMILSGILSRYLDENGHLGISDEGWAQIEGKYSTGVNLLGEDLYAEMTNPNNNVAMGQMWHMGIAGREEQFGVVSDFIVPAVGVPFSVEGVALINGANNPEAAKRFIDWFGSAETMNAFAQEFDYLPANPNALAGLSDFTIIISELPHQNIDWDAIAPRMDEWLEHIYLTYKG